ncbi:P-loop containing nucleoside triphosphate hydrolase protein [Bipolaris maydis]|uniref:P-loop containing nucleoside triphosphate hydrolase protein n=1 Tax=Cochliobolus heterostrophus TaxID=5016 RepID=UPI0024DB4F63|nr:P-loop containing nucleoside triphosphate hydrolase protein [Bipolaris maydis]KAJ5055871.1 P-loop containing nucleoside triphosphate hydrolase protein [Bipolaris maydis]KAJ6193629.1 P-loop containing nucleoside triphosphate hydrolase protein [Bipolaris maydis]KAJ6212262.1 P-loop containing nucleoside triphosphate hydrolase protein [Bipolaris maydis]KAJ6266831.1 P-loop containing nucleoside triphosphate hydrolase protein [Bipolaris maydis]
MTDLLHVLPDFDATPFSHLLPSLDKALITTNDVLTLDAPTVAKRAHVPTGELRKLADAVVAALHRQLGFGPEEPAPTPKHDWACISTLDDELDAALGGGIPRGYLVEVTGESGAGKTQLLLTLLLASQLKPPHGFAKSAVYVSTEAVLSTTRLAQLLSAHPALVSLPAAEKPSLSRILSIQTPDLESQEHILRYQLPVAIKKHDVGLVILDSVAANYRAEFDKQSGGNAAASMARRGTQLAQLGALLREIARTEGIAIVVANQVADRFTKAPPAAYSSASSNAASRTTSTSTGSQTNDVVVVPPQPSQQDQALVLSPDPLSLDHQQAWFTGWGDSPYEQLHVQKTPSLGLVWTNQIACRIALKKQPVFASRPLIHTVNGHDEWADEDRHISKWRRWFKLVFAPWAPPSPGRGIEFEIQKSGIRHVVKEGKQVALA